MLVNKKQELNDLMSEIEGMDQAHEDFVSKVDQADALKVEIEKAEQAQAKLDALKAFDKPKSVQDEKPMNIQVKEGFVDDPKKGFKSAGEFLSALALNHNDYSADARLAHIAQTSGQHTTINDGLMIPAELDPNINVLGKGVSDDWLSKITIANTNSNSKEFRRSAATTRGGSTGLVAGRIREVTQMSSTREVFEKSTCKLDKLYIYSEVSEEDLEDFSFLQSHLMTTAPELLRIKVGEEYLTGNGVGRAFGMFDASNGDQVTVSARADSNDVQAADVLNMYARHLKGANSFWLVNHSVWAKLPLMSVENQPVYQTDFREGMAGRLLGLPVYTTEDCATLGTQGDIRLINPDGYIGLQKVGGMKSASSMHVKFDYDIMAFKWCHRISGIPLYNAPYTPRNGNTLSHFVDLSAST